MNLPIKIKGYMDLICWLTHLGYLNQILIGWFKPAVYKLFSKKLNPHKVNFVYHNLISILLLSKTLKSKIIFATLTWYSERILSTPCFFLQTKDAVSISLAFSTLNSLALRNLSMTGSEGALPFCSSDMHFFSCTSLNINHIYVDLTFVTCISLRFQKFFNIYNFFPVWHRITEISQNIKLKIIT